MIQIKNKQTNKKTRENSTTNTEPRAPVEKVYSVETAQITASDA